MALLQNQPTAQGQVQAALIRSQSDSHGSHRSLSHGCSGGPGDVSASNRNIVMATLDAKDSKTSLLSEPYLNNNHAGAHSGGQHNVGIRSSSA